MARIPESELILNKDGSVYHLNLKPSHISDTIITVGDPSRVYMVSEHFDDVDFEMNRREFITHSGTLRGKRLTVMSTGMGTDNVEIFMTELDALANVDLKKRDIKAKKRRLKIIRVGTSGAMQEDIPLGTHLVSDYAVGLDTLMCFYDLPQDAFEEGVAARLQEETNLPFRPYVVRGSQELLDKVGHDMVRGNTITCPGFYAPQGREIRATLKNKRLLESLNYFHEDGFWLTNFEMETAGYYAMGRLLDHEVLSVNAIIANRIHQTFAKDPNKVISSLIKTVLDRVV